MRRCLHAGTHAELECGGRARPGVVIRTKEPLSCVPVSVLRCSFSAALRPRITSSLGVGHAEARRAPRERRVRRRHHAERRHRARRSLCVRLRRRRQPRPTRPACTPRRCERFDRLHLRQPRSHDAPARVARLGRHAASRSPRTTTRSASSLPTSETSPARTSTTTGPTHTRSSTRRASRRAR